MSNLNLCSRDSCPHTDKGCMDSREEMSHSGPSDRSDPTNALRPIILDNACIICLTAAAGQELADIYSPDTVIASSQGKEVHDPRAFYIRAALLCQAFAQSTLGGMFVCGANDLITIFVAPECFSLCSYLLSGYTKRDVQSNKAITKYLLMGGASSSILVHGFSWLYGSSGGEIELQEIVNGLINTQMYNSAGVSIALIFITVGIGFKVSPAPSHQ
ncbi:hypothetical protein Syun_001733 [Stephania yunnanensis]|uniref:NADH:quinone oxidoreductase/Mrp antiporter transmembrane domain-containing protein n=1 Tax=Stephania yunnanensis TaxID=152371 RepID=A0AAP0LFE4_9MAGN